MKKIMWSLAGVFIGLNLFAGVALARTEMLPELGEITNQCISSDGRFVVYQHGFEDYDGINVFDRQTGVVKELSAFVLDGLRPMITGNGRYVIYSDLSASSGKIYDQVNDEVVYSFKIPVYTAYTINADGLVAYINSVNNKMELYDIESRAVVSSFSNHGFNTNTRMTISGDGRYIFMNQTNQNIYRFDVSTGIRTQLVTGSGVSLKADPWPIQASYDGNRVVFGSAESNLLPGDTNGVPDVFLYDIQNDALRRVSVSDQGDQGNQGSTGQSITKDGRYVAFSSSATNLVSDDTNSKSDVFVYDTVENSINRVSLSDLGHQGNNGSRYPAISPDGKYVVYTSEATNLVPNGGHSLYLYTRDVNQTDDTAAPVTTCNIAGSIGGSGSASTITYTLTADDNINGSGVEKIEYSFDHTTWLLYDQPITVSKASGPNQLWIRSADYDGNVEIARKVNVAIE